LDKTVAVSFEELNIKIVQASSKGSELSVDRAEVIEYDELDDFLKRERASEFIVTYDFKEAYHGFLSIPIIKPAYQRKIIASELSNITKQENVSFTFVPIDERIVDKKRVLEIFYFAVDNEVIQDVVGRFYDFNKVVKAVYPTVFSAASLIRSGTPDEANMGLFSTGEEKIIFFTKNGSVYFIRNYESSEAELSDFDIQNINMTISYCYQNIQINPSSVVLLGSLSESCNISTMTSAPLSSLNKGSNIHFSSEKFNEFILPIASFYAPQSSNMLSGDFKNINMLIKYIGYSSKAFALLAVLCIGLIFYGVTDSLDKRDRLHDVMSDRNNVLMTHSEYMEREDVLKNITPAVNFLNRPGPEIRALMVDLAEINMSDLKFRLLEAKAENKNSYAVTIEGVSYAEKYYSFQSAFDEVIAAMQKIKGLTVKSKSVNLSDKSFRIELQYRKTA
jgi:hypothetical protein